MQSVEFATPTVAIEDGLARVAAKDDTPPSASRYTAVHLLQDGKWLMASVREASIEIPSNYPRLQKLAWLVGNWETKSEHTVVHTKIRWMANRSFLEREYTVQKDGLTSASGLQIIGWDPQAKQIASWSFDSSGAHGAGRWAATPEGCESSPRACWPTAPDFVARLPCPHSRRGKRFRLAFHASQGGRR